MKNKILLIILLAMASLALVLIGTKISQKRQSLLEPNGENTAHIQGEQTELIFDQDIKPSTNIEKTNNKQTTESEAMQAADKTKLSMPSMQIDQNKTYSAVITTNRGEFTVSLDAKNTPLTVNNFVALAKMGFYEDTIFHRVIQGFMIQGGDPAGNGSGGPGYTFKDEQSPHKLVQGSLAMANRGPNTNGSQFFIVTAEATPWLDGKHTNFGKVTQGLDTILAIEKVQTDTKDKPLTDIIIKKIEIIEQ